MTAAHFLLLPEMCHASGQLSANFKVYRDVDFTFIGWARSSFLAV
jgi:hypothetical protein